MLLGPECFSDAFFPGSKAERGKTEGMCSEEEDGTGGRWEVLAHRLFTPPMPGMAAHHWQESAEGH